MQRQLSAMILLSDGLVLGLSPTSNASGRNFTLPEFAEVSCEELVLHEIFYKSARRKTLMKVEMKLLERKRELKVVNLLWVLFLFFSGTVKLTLSNGHLVVNSFFGKLP